MQPEAVRISDPPEPEAELVWLSLAYLQPRGPRKAGGRTHICSRLSHLPPAVFRPSVVVALASSHPRRSESDRPSRTRHAPGSPSAGALFARIWVPHPAEGAAAAAPPKRPLSHRPQRHLPAQRPVSRCRGVSAGQRDGLVRGRGLLERVLRRPPFVGGLFRVVRHRVRRARRHAPIGVGSRAGPRRLARAARRVRQLAAVRGDERRRVRAAAAPPTTNPLLLLSGTCK